MNDPGCQSDFEESLALIGGLNPFGQPVLRRVWGGTAEKWEGGGWCLRYPASGKPDLGYEYRDENGDTQFTWRLDEVPNNAIPLVVSRQRKSETGDEYHYIERWRSAEFLKSTGRFTVIRDDEGDQVLPELPSQGHYDYFARLEKRDGSYHPADGEALMVIKAMWDYEHNFSLNERNQHVRADRKPKQQPRRGTRVSYGKLEVA